MTQINLDRWLGARVRLRGCHDSGEPGTVIRAERGRLTIWIIGAGIIRTRSN